MLQKMHMYRGKKRKMEEKRETTEMVNIPFENIKSRLYPLIRAYEYSEKIDQLGISFETAEGTEYSVAPLCAMAILFSDPDRIDDDIQPWEEILKDRSIDAHQKYEKLMKLKGWEI